MSVMRAAPSETLSHEAIGTALCCANAALLHAAVTYHTALQAQGPTHQAQWDPTAGGGVWDAGACWITEPAGLPKVPAEVGAREWAGAPGMRIPGSDRLQRRKAQAGKRTLNQPCNRQGPHQHNKCCKHEHTVTRACAYAHTHTYTLEYIHTHPTRAAVQPQLLPWRLTLVHAQVREGVTQESGQVDVPLEKSCVAAVRQDHALRTPDEALQPGTCMCACACVCVYVCVWVKSMDAQCACKLGTLGATEEHLQKRTATLCLMSKSLHFANVQETWARPDQACKIGKCICPTQTP
eukprot:1148073-Pelagomonas_calceolata.AAC.15